LNGDVYNHEPADYPCPFCHEDPHLAQHPLEIIRRYEKVTVRLNPKWWPGTPGNLLVVPHQHVENLFDLPDDLAGPLQLATQEAALALKRALACGGVSTRQHNEPDGGQDVWHYHVHVFPRFTGDGLYGSEGRWQSGDAMSSMADRLRSAWPNARAS
jgi:histidine triad (HIT) family protein